MVSTRASTSRHMLESPYTAIRRSEMAPKKRTGNKADEAIKTPISSRRKAEPNCVSTKLATMTSKKRTANEVDEATSRAPAKSARRKRDTHATASRRGDVIDLTCEGADATKIKKTRAPKKKAPKGEAPERRARPFRNHPPKTYLERLARATSQRYVLSHSWKNSTNVYVLCHRMYVVDHSVTTTHLAIEMNFDIVGSTGNLYKTTIGRLPSCDCPDSRKGHQCKHVCYGM